MIPCCQGRVNVFLVSSFFLEDLVLLFVKNISSLQIESMPMKVSIIVTTYNWPEALALSLSSILRQSFRDFQIVVADDGSDERTALAVKDVLGSAGVGWIHVRHADKMIRQARIKNLGVKFSQGEYLIFVDHDVVLHPEFIADHLALAQKGFFLQGKRAFLPDRFTQKVLKRGGFVAPSPFLAGLGNRKNSLRCLWLGKIFLRPKKFQTALRGCNFSVAKEDFMHVDGFDEVFDGIWGREDSDICYRLFHNGIMLKNLWFRALQYHLFHRTQKNKAKDRLDFELQKSRQEKRIKAIQGFSRLSKEGEVIASS